MRLHRSRHPALFVAAATRSPRTSIAHGAITLALLLVAACVGDTPTDPVTRRLTPAPADLTLTGGVGLHIFDSAPPGEVQATGDARGLNNAGQVTGGVYDLGGVSDDSDPYRWSATTGAVKITGCCGSQVGNDINDAGTVVGLTQISAAVGGRGFVATGTTLTVLPLLPGANPEPNSEAVAINKYGEIVGTSPVGNTTHATLWSPSLVPQDLGTLGGSTSRAIDISSSGLVIGSSQLTGNAAAHFFLWSAVTGMVDLNALIGVPLESVVEINEENQIIGTYKTPSGATHAFIYTPGSGVDDLGTLGGTSSAPTGINEHGDVVGSSTLADGSTHAFFWTFENGMEDITALSGVTDVRRLNNSLQTLTGASPSDGNLPPSGGRPRLVQLQYTQGNARPTAFFSVECNGLTCVLDASGSLDDKPGLSFAWNLGKYPNGSATGAVVTVTYPHASQRTVDLTVTDTFGATSSISRTFTVRESPIAAFTYSCTGLTCSFDSGGSTSSGAPISWRIWTFGDGQSTVGTDAIAPSHTYAGAGTYPVTLEIWATDQSERAVITKQITVSAPAQNQAPVARFTVSCTNLVCTFDATSSTDDKGIVSYAWDLNKYPGGSATGSTVTTTYPHAGPRSVTLTVRDAGGLTNSITKTFDPGASTSTDAPPVARFTSSCTGTICTLNAATSTDDNGIVAYDWNLGKSPGGTASGVSVTTDYWHSGTRTVTLTVTDTKGQKNSVTKTVTVP